MADSFIQVPPDAGGKQVDTTPLVRGDNTGVTVQRQRVVHPDAITALGDVHSHILVELRVQSLLLSQLLTVGFGIPTDDLNILRDDIGNTMAVDDVV